MVIGATEFQLLLQDFAIRKPSAAPLDENVREISSQIRMRELFEIMCREHMTEHGLQARESEDERKKMHDLGTPSEKIKKGTMDDKITWVLEVLRSKGIYLRLTAKIETLYYGFIEDELNRQPKIGEMKRSKKNVAQDFAARAQIAGVNSSNVYRFLQLWELLHEFREQGIWALILY